MNDFTYNTKRLFRWLAIQHALPDGLALAGVLGEGSAPPDPGVETTITGVSPLLLEAALAKPMVSLKQYGKCSQASTPTPSAPVDIVCNNGALKWDSVNERIYSDGTPEVLTVTDADSNTQTATAENLLSVDSDADEQEIIHGAIKRKCAVRVLDGTEDWSLAGTGVYSFQLGEANGTAWRKEAISTHYVGTDATTATMPSDSIKCATNAAGTVYSLYIKPSAYPSSSANTFKAYVAEQYAAGTPIIVVHPLVEETHESVTAQPLRTTEGDNTITVTAEVSGIQLEAVYMAATS